ncbi:MAG TPA: hypothetical protein V6D26_10550 [Stenomitos sp.]
MTLSIKLDPEVKRQLEEIAKQQNISLNRLVLRYISQGIQADTGELVHIQETFCAMQQDKEGKRNFLDASLSYKSLPNISVENTLDRLVSIQSGSRNS